MCALCTLVGKRSNMIGQLCLCTCEKWEKNHTWLVWTAALRTSEAAQNICVNFTCLMYKGLNTQLSNCVNYDGFIAKVVQDGLLSWYINIFPPLLLSSLMLMLYLMPDLYAQAVSVVTDHNRPSLPTFILIFFMKVLGLMFLVTLLVIYLLRYSHQEESGGWAGHPLIRKLMV